MARSHHGARFRHFAGRWRYVDRGALKAKAREQRRRTGHASRNVRPAWTSQHMKAEAADFHVDGVGLVEVFDFIRTSAIPFGQVILEGASPEHPTWIHLSLGEPYRPAAKCRQALRWDATHGYRAVT